ncbi:hypothetical protein IT575_02675 [bacterium]|nr:hypothetical protein [bacterium]
MPAQDDILINRSEGVEQLSDAELELLKRKPEMQQSLRENQALSALAASQPPAPVREATLQQAYARAGASNVEDKMTLFSRILGGRPWYVQAAAALALLAGLFALATLLPPQQKSYASQDGFVLSYDLGQAGTPGEGGDPRDADPRIAEVQRVLEEFKKESQARAQAEGKELTNKVAIQVRNENGKLSMSVAVMNPDAELLETIKQRLAQVPGLPAPTEQPATWFAAEGAMPGDGEGLSLNLDGHFFTFGPGFTAEEVERTVNDWLAANKPGSTARVKVERGTGPDGEERVEVRIEIGDPEHADKAEGGEAR